MNPLRIIDADYEAIGRNEAKGYLRITESDDDDEVNLFITAMRHKTETHLGKTLITSTWQYRLDCFDDIVLPMPPVQSITSIQYVDTDGITQSFSDYQFDVNGRLMPSYGNSWPATRDQMNAVTITYIAGESDILPDIKFAMLLWIGACDVAREDTTIGTIVTSIPENARDILAPHRIINA